MEIENLSCSFQQQSERCVVFFFLVNSLLPCVRAGPIWPHYVPLFSGSLLQFRRLSFIHITMQHTVNSLKITLILQPARSDVEIDPAFVHGK